MTREIITIGVGGAGVRAAAKFWELVLAEHSITPLGRPDKDTPVSYSFLEETGAGQFVPRSLLVDLEPDTIDEVRNGKYSNIFHPEYMLSGKKDAANNFAGGYYTIGQEIIDKVNDRLRKLVDNSNGVQGFIVFHSVGGGTGSGLGALILERLAVDYRSSKIFTFSIYPSLTESLSSVSSYNAALSTHHLLKRADLTFVMDNEALVKYCQDNLAITNPTYEQLNELIAYAAADVTTSLRFEGDFNADLNEFITNMVPFPRIKFLAVSMGGLTTKARINSGIVEEADIQSITESTVSSQYYLTTLSNFDVELDKYMAISMNYRGDVKAKEASKWVQWVKTNKKVSFVDWCPTGFKVGHNIFPRAGAEGWTIYPAPTRSFCMMSFNNMAMMRFFKERVSTPYDTLFSHRAYVHWYTNEGMEEGEFAEAREDLGFLEQDYLEVINYEDEDEESSEDEG